MQVQEVCLSQKVMRMLPGWYHVWSEMQMCKLPKLCRVSSLDGASGGSEMDVGIDKIWVIRVLVLTAKGQT